MGSKQTARKRWGEATSKIEPERLLELTRVFAAQWESRPKSERKFIPMPQTWLNDERWDQVVDESAATSTALASAVAGDRWREVFELVGERPRVPDFGDVSDAERVVLFRDWCREWWADRV